MNTNLRLVPSCPDSETCETANDVLRVVHAEFVRWFEAQNAGPEGRYAEIASEVCEL